MMTFSDAFSQLCDVFYDLVQSNLAIVFIILIAVIYALLLHGLASIVYGHVHSEDSGPSKD